MSEKALLAFESMIGKEPRGKSCTDTLCAVWLEIQDASDLNADAMKQVMRMNLFSAQRGLAIVDNLDSNDAPECMWGKLAGVAKVLEFVNKGYKGEVDYTTLNDEMKKAVSRPEFVEKYRVAKEPDQVRLKEEAFEKIKANILLGVEDDELLDDESRAAKVKRLNGIFGAFVGCEEYPIWDSILVPGVEEDIDNVVDAQDRHEFQDPQAADLRNMLEERLPSAVVAQLEEQMQESPGATTTFSSGTAMMRRTSSFFKRSSKDKDTKSVSRRNLFSSR